MNKKRKRKEEQENKLKYMIGDRLNLDHITYELVDDGNGGMHYVIKQDTPQRRRSRKKVPRA